MATKIKEVTMKKLIKSKALPWWAALALVFLLCFSLILKLPNVQAMATVALVAVTLIYVMLLYKSILNTSSMRREDRVLDFKTRQMDKIVNWAKGVRTELFSPSGLNLRMRLQTCAIENEWLIITAGIFGEEFQKIVEKAAKDLWAYIDALKKPAIDYEQYEREVPLSFSKVMESALKVEAELVETSLYK